VKRSECSLKRAHDEPTAHNLGWFLQLKGTVSNLGNLAWERLMMPVVPVESRLKNETNKCSFDRPSSTTSTNPAK
jgi:hypothetical protein